MRIYGIVPAVSSRVPVPFIVPEMAAPDYQPPGAHTCPEGAEWEKSGDTCFLFRPDDLWTWSGAYAACLSEVQGYDGTGRLATYARENMYAIVV